MEQEKDFSESELENSEEKRYPDPEYLDFPIPEHIDISQMSQKKIRKLKKTLYWESKIPEIRAKHRNNLKVKKLKKKEEIQKKVEEGLEVNLNEYPEYAHARSRSFKAKFREELQNAVPIIFDCCFDNLHYPKDLRSLGN
jgi:hypothetical protein